MSERKAGSPAEEMLKEGDAGDQALLAAAQESAKAMLAHVAKGISIEHALEATFIKGAAYGVGVVRNTPPLVVVIGPRPPGMPATPLDPKTMN